MTELIGFLAGFITTICYVPQALHVLRSRDTKGISLLAYSLLFLGVFLWMIYGVLKGDWPLMLANAVSLLFIGAILLAKRKHG